MSEALKSKVAKSRKLTTPRKEDNSLTGQIDLYTPAYKTAMMGTDEDAARFARGSENYGRSGFTTRKMRP